MNLLLKILVLFVALFRVSDAEVILANNGDKLDLYEGVHYRLINKKSGRQLAAQECEKQRISEYPRYVYFLPVTDSESTNIIRNYELIFRNSQKNKIRVTIEKTAHNDYYKFRQSNADTVTNSSSLCPLTHSIGSCGTFVCNSTIDEDLELWKPLVNIDRYNFNAQFTDFTIIGDGVSLEFERKRTKLSIVDGEIFHNSRKYPIDHFVTNYYFSDEFKEKVSVEFDKNFELTLSPHINTKKYRIDLKIPVNSSSNSEKYIRKHFHFDIPKFHIDMEFSRRYAHLSLDRIVIEPFECIEYRSYADVIDSVVLSFQAKAKITAIGPYGAHELKTGLFPIGFSKTLLKEYDVKLETEATDYGLVFTVNGNLTTSVVLGFSYSVKTIITCDPNRELQ